MASLVGAGTVADDAEEGTTEELLLDEVEAVDTEITTPYGADDDTKDEVEEEGVALDDDDEGLLVDVKAVVIESTMP